MALQTSGRITLQQIANEFGGGHPLYLSQFYRGGGRVPNSSINARIPTSGRIALSDFYGAANYVPGNIAYTAPGNYVFTVPNGVTVLNVDMIGGGASGRPGALYSDSYDNWVQNPGNDGGASALNGIISAAGGTTGSTSVYYRYNVFAGAGGSIGGGSANQSNGDGGDGGSSAWGSGGVHGSTNCYVQTGFDDFGNPVYEYNYYSYVGGAITPATAGTGYGAGGGGGGGWSDSGPGAGGAGGGAGTRVTTSIAVTPGQQIGITVGAGGATAYGTSGTGYGAPGCGGLVYLSW